MKDLIEKRRAEFQAAEDKANAAVRELQAMRTTVEQRIAKAQAEAMLNAAARQTCEALLKDIEPPAPSNGQEA